VPDNLPHGMFLIALGLNHSDMKHIQVIHNPGAGDQQHTKDNIIGLLKDNGYRVSYLDTKKEKLKKFNTNADLILIAGGDGTVRKVAKQIIKGKVMDMPPRLALLPLGTANNVSGALGLTDDIENGIKSWDQNNNKPFDVGRIHGVPDAKFFLESFGFGIFPYMMKKSEELPEDTSATPEESMLNAKKYLRKLTEEYGGVECHIEIDEEKFSGSYLLVEIMNTPSIGPKLDISPDSDPGDGQLEIIFVPTQDKERFLGYLDDKINNRDSDFVFETKRGRDIKITWNDSNAHVDDEFINWKSKYEADIHLKGGLLNFLVPAN
jgi:diacylglycerol kinase family enzyme